MKEHLDDEGLIRKAMEELPMSYEMPEDLKSKAIDLALESKRKNHSARRPWVVAGLTAGVAALALGAYFMAPKPAVAKTWAMVRQAVNQITSFQMTVRSQSEGESVKNLNIAVADGKVLMRSEEGEIMLIDGGSLQVYDKKENKVVRLKFTGMDKILDSVPNVMGDLANHMDLKGEIAKLEKEYGKENIRIGSIYQQEGRGVYDVEMRDPKTNEKAFMTVDAQTDLPIYIRASGEHNGPEKVEVILRYNDAIDMKFDVPANVKYEDVDLSKLTNMGIEMGKRGQEMGREMEKQGKEFGKAMEEIAKDIEKSFSDKK